MNARKRSLAVLALFFLAVACSPSAPKTGVDAGHDSLVIRSDEINPVRDAYAIDVIKQLRPNWLTMNSTLGSGIKRASGFAVYADNTRLGGLEMLGKISTSEIESIRFVDGNRAAFLPGMGSDVVLGAIMLTMKH